MDLLCGITTILNDDVAADQFTLFDNAQQLRRKLRYISKNKDFAMVHPPYAIIFNRHDDIDSAASV